LVAALVAVPGLAGCSATPTAADEGSTGYVAGDGSTVVLPIDERQPAPELTGTTLDGGTYSTAAADGAVTVVNVWASWCAPCRAEAPTLERSFQQHLDQGVEFVGLNIRDSDAAARAFVERYAITYPNIVDPEGRVQLALRDTLPPQSIPSTVFFDKQGRVAARVLGEVDQARLNGIIDTLVAEPA
jgi:thiol-disulfide isomerase/thioredoxin